MNAYIKTHDTQAHDTHTHRTADMVLYLYYINANTEAKNTN